MKILHVTPSFHSSSGGVAYALRNIAGSLQPLDTSQVIVTTGQSDLAVDGVPVVSFPAAGSFRAHPDFTTWLKDNVRDYDLVHIHSIWLFHSRIAARVAARAGIPYVVSPCGMLDEWSMSQKALKKRVYYTLFEKNVLRNAAALHCTVAAEAGSRRVKELAVPTAVIPLAIEDAFFRDTPVVRKPAQVLFLGRLHFVKQPDVLIRAFIELAGERPELSLVIAGGGDEDYAGQLAELAAPCSKQISFTGMIGGAEKIRLFKESGVFALPSLHENFGIAVAEAMAAGAVPVISDQVALLDVITTHKAGFVGGTDVDSFRDALKAAIESADIEAIRGNCTRYASEHFSQRAVGSQFLEFYQSHVPEPMPDAPAPPGNG